MIHIININNEDYSNKPNFYYIGRPSILSNPYTFLPVEKTKAIFQCKTREEALEKYSSFYDLEYGHNKEFTKIINEIFEKYKNGEEIYFGCFCPSEDKCHGGIIKKKLEQKLLKEKINSIKTIKKECIK